MEQKPMTAPLRRSMRLYGSVTPEGLLRIRDVLLLEPDGAPRHLTAAELAGPARARAAAAPAVTRRLAQECQDVWLAELSHADEPGAVELAGRLADDVRTVALELGLGVQTELEDEPQAARVAAPPPGAGPVSREQAEAVAVEWVSSGRAEPVRAGLYEFELGYIVHQLWPADGRGRMPREIGTPRGIIDRQTGELTLWPSLALPTVADLYREHVRRQAPAAGHGPPT